MFRSFVPAAALVLVLGGGLAARQPAAVDTSTIGPRVGSVAPAWSGIDQFGKSHTLQSALGPKGAMLVFFRSADW
ncbi:MAG: hypothetical protein IT180_03230 [Acidobacteria bacterium]|nr:hypothetical protein [Acidobacteriota bacterium]